MASTPSYFPLPTEDLDESPRRDVSVEELLVIDSPELEVGPVPDIFALPDKAARRRAHFIRSLILAAILITAAVFSLLVIARLKSVPRGAAASQAQRATAAECKRVMVRKFDSLDAGFGSEYGVYLHAKALEREMNWTVVPDTRDWIYGDLGEIFVPPTYECTIPSDVSDLNWAKPGPEWREFGTAGWKEATRLYLTRHYQHLLELEGLLRVHGVERGAMDEFARKTKLWRLDAEHLTLPYGESVPRGEEKAFRAQAAVLEKEWIPTERMQAQIDRLRGRVGLDDTASRARRPVVVLQIRLGDKRTEAQDIGRSGSHMKQDDLSVYFRAAQLALSRLYVKELTPTPFPVRTSSSPKPLLVVMTAETGIVESLIALDTKHEFEIILSPAEELTSKETAEFDRLFGTTHETTPLSVRSRSLLSQRWLQKDFLRASPGLRLALTRQLVAELIVYSKYADAFVVSGNSNMGRIALLLAGEEGAMGPSGHRATGGRVRSIDVPWFPGVWFMSPFAPGQWS
ncbi:hypothetical protein EXIGLDRAFT_747650 [Exidia glandulosa HHB12029]|uniref:Uncharacterized protein n=1 Tax=Exidia glandulosa HHB12029 TaxID=1314781 RepID=A0A165KIP4_EXIGL|nr:hypothetical protein EXIGLDRAFT_747650 [Exidia glandulosa HHB12029]